MDVQDSPTLVAIVGPNGSGKSSIIESFKLPEVMEVVCPDSIAKDLEKMIDDPAERWRKAATHAEVNRNLLISQRKSFAFETVGSREDKIEFIRNAKELGYFIQIIFITTCDPNINRKRIDKRVSEGGHDVDTEKMMKRYYRTMALLPAYITLADDFVAYDNSGSTSVLVLTKKEGKMHMVKSFELIPWASDIYDRYPNIRTDLDDPKNLDFYEATFTKNGRHE